MLLAPPAVLIELHWWEVYIHTLIREIYCIYMYMYVLVTKNPSRQKTFSNREKSFLNAYTLPTHAKHSFAKFFHGLNKFGEVHVHVHVRIYFVAEVLVLHGITIVGNLPE